MTSLNIFCAICSEYFGQNDVIYSTRCGHVFHKLCLFKWLTRSYTCPQCRKHCLTQYCHQLYLNFVEATVEENDRDDVVFPKTYDWVYVDHLIDFDDDFSFGFSFGCDENGDEIYAARARYNGDLVPCYYIPSKKVAIVPWGFKSHCVTEDIEILDVSNDDAEYKWVAASEGDLPENAFATGNTVMCDMLYTARAKHKGKMLYGKLHRRYYQAYMPYKGKEITNAIYEVLVRIPQQTTTEATDNGNT